ncbi:MAG TPA: RNA polymerase factor sigma-54 [Pseudomonadales bacterium]
MKQSLQLKQGLQVNMTPQLQQAIRLLQLSSLDLQQEIQHALDSNPLLERIDDDDSEIHQPDNREGIADNNASDDYEGGDQQLAEWSDDIPDELPVDTRWDDVYQNASSSLPASDQRDLPDPADSNSAHQDLKDHLRWQLNTTRLVDSDRVIALAIIDSLNPNGLLSLPARELYQSLADELDIEFEEFEAVRQLIQEFDPVGVASVDLRECLLVQLRQFPDNTPFVNDARLIVDRHLQLLASHDYAQLKRRTRFKEGRLKEAVNMILRLNPHPGDSIDSGDTEYITPDVIVKKRENRWMVELAADNAVRLRINNDYASLIQRADNSEENTYLRNNLQEARWFIKSLQSRNETLLKVASKIVEHQRGFLDYGEEAMKPLILQDIARDIDMHESTISRVTNRKYMHTPRGIFELKYFFSSHVSTDAGGECSSTAIRAMIKKLISQESSKKPLSDNKLASLLSEQGIHVARRTVAKYREAMAIPPSNERKRLV